MIYEMVSGSIYYICLILLLSKISSIFASRPYRAAAVRGKPTQAKAWARFSRPFGPTIRVYSPKAFRVD